MEPGVRGYIPAFAGAGEAAARLAALPAWQQAQVLKVVPDRAQLPVRILALEQGKIVYMPAPRLATPEPFYVLDPGALLTSKTVIATTVHELQVLDEAIPEATHDFRVDVIATPERVIWCHEPRRPSGIDWRTLHPEQLAAIPALGRMKNA